MHFNKAVLLAVSATLAEQAVASNAHRHAHRDMHRQAEQQPQKRAMATEWVTDWVTVFVTEGETSTTTTSTSTKPTTTSVHTTSTKPTTTSVPPRPTTHSVAPTTHSTTMATVVKSAAAPVATGLINLSMNIPVLGGGASSAAAAPTGSVSSGSSSSTNSGGAFPGKRGIAYNDPSLAAFMGDICDSCQWGYNWGATSDDLTSSISYVPMLWGMGHVEGWAQAAETGLANGAKALFSFNEPDNAGQSNMSPQQAASGHAQYMNPYAGRALIGAPAITNSQNVGQGISWLESFVEACESEGCHYDFCNVHWYNGYDTADTLFSLISDAHNTCGGKPVVLSEFAPSGSDDQISQFLTDNVPQLENLEYLLGYSYFMTSVGSLLSDSNVLSDFGKIYADL